MKIQVQNGTIFELACTIVDDVDYKCFTVDKNLIANDVLKVRFDECATTAAGNNGYFVFPRCSEVPDYSLYYFGRHNGSYTKVLKYLNMPIFGYKGDDCCYIAVISGMPFNFSLEIKNSDGVHAVTPIFETLNKEIYEDLKIEYFYLHGEDANYSGMARKYREYLYTKSSLKTLKQKAELNPQVGYTAESLMVRIRCGWKPAPPTVLHQTVENEPEMHIACDFDKISLLIDEFKAQGIRKAEFCLVGWNVSGHDGRWPQAFPVEEKLGGEDKLRKLIKKAQDNGYAMVCHTNHTDQYEIADCYDSDNDIVNIDGKTADKFDYWSGGEMHGICPLKGLESAKSMLPKVAELGFKGSHYIDVLGLICPRLCYHKDHPVSFPLAVECAKEKCRLSRNLFGSVSSEGAQGFICDELDYGLYISFYNGTKVELLDESIPFWQIVYHGSVLSNPYTNTINCTFKTKRDTLKAIEYGARPSFYYYSKFYSNNNWMGDTDCTCDDEFDMKNSVAKIKEADAWYKEMSETVYCFIDEHKKIADGVYKVLYSNGVCVTVDYNKETYIIEK